MAMLADLLKQVFADQSRKGIWQGRKNPLELPQLPATEGDSAGRIMKPADMQSGQTVAKDPGNIYNDAGQIVDYDLSKLDGSDPITKMLRKYALSEGSRGRPDKEPADGSRVGNGNPFANLLDKNRGEAGRGTIMGFLSRFIDPTPMEQQTGTVQGRGTVGGGDPNRGVPGTGVDPALNPKPTQDQTVPALRPGTPTPVPLEDRTPFPPPADYSMPNAMDPNQIEELRNSILGQTQQMNPNYPDGLSGRMNSPYSTLDQKDQMRDAERQDRQMSSNQVPGYTDRE